MDPTLQNKLKLLFDHFKNPNYSLSNYYGDSIINKFHEKTDPDIETIQKLPILTNLIVEAMDGSPKHITVQVFITRLLGTVVVNELQFGKAFYYKGEEIATGISSINNEETPPSLRVAYIELALAIINHESGIKWMLQNDCWKHLIQLRNDKQTVFTVRQLHKFTANFLWKLDELNLEASIIQVLDEVLRPVLSFNYIDLKSISSEEEEKHAKVLVPMFHTLLAIFNSRKRMQKKTCIMPLLLDKYNVMNHLYIIMNCLHVEDRIVLIARIGVYLIFARMFTSKPYEPSNLYNQEDLIDLLVFFFNFISLLSQRRAITSILDLCNACCDIWAQFSKDIEMKYVDEQGNKSSLDLHFLSIQIVPILFYVKKHCEESSAETLMENISKMSHTVCEHTIKAAFAVRDLVKDMDYMEVAFLCVKRLSCMKSYLISNEQASLIFQALFYLLEDYAQKEIVLSGDDAENYEVVQLRINIMTYVMDIMDHLTKNFDINWNESLEVLCLYSVVSSILKKPNLSVKFIVASLNVLTTSVRRFKPPNMSLLLDTSSGPIANSPALNDNGKLIYMKLHDLNWEIRDSALELLLVCTEISLVKFPPFQKQILENNLLEVAAAIAFNDHERYVRATALRCLAAATHVGALWTDLIEKLPDIQEKVLNLFVNNQEGLVRKEATNVLCQIYKNTHVTPEFLQKLYRHMTSGAISDFHWEAQIAALKFWSEVIQSHLTEQGMLDGSFPTVTFSKKNRKIVQLNEKEIQKRLIKCLEDLSSVGCLDVLVLSLLEDTDSEIMEVALSISQDLLDLLTKYKVLDVLETTQNDLQKLNDMLHKLDDVISEKKEEHMDQDEQTKSDDVIDGIVNCDDMSLLSNIYQDQMNLEVQPKLTEIKVTNYVTPQMFIAHLKSKDFLKVIEYKKSWKEGIRNLSSILEDALGVYEFNEDINSKDCY